LLLPQAGATTAFMDSDYVKSVIKGLTIGHICLGIAATAAFVTVIVVGWTQLDILVSWVPVVLAAVFLLVTTLLLQKDMVAQNKHRDPEER
jgi:purine-cytosine permease-like protein